MKMKKIHLITVGLLLVVFLTVASASAVPTINSVTPRSADPGYTGNFDVYGTDFEIPSGVWICSTNARSCIWTNKIDTVTSDRIRIQVSIPTNAPWGAYNVYIYEPHYGWVLKEEAFYVPVQPEIYSMMPDWGKTGTSGYYTLLGSGFKPGMEVSIGRDINRYYATEMTFVSSTEVHCTLTIPANAPTGSYNVMVRNLGGTEVARANAFRVYAQPTVSMVSPNRAPPGITGYFSVFGSNFKPDAQVSLSGGGTKIDATGETFKDSGRIVCTLTIPKNAYKGYYKVSVRNPDAYEGSKENAFFIGDLGTLTIISPNGEEVWQRGTLNTVTWSYTGDPGYWAIIDLLKGDVQVERIGGTFMGSGGKGSYTWVMNPVGMTGTDYKVRVQSLNQPTIKDTSDDYFTITPAGGTTTPTITVTSPNGGEVWKRGTTHQVMWTYTGDPGPTVKIELWQGSTLAGTATYSTSTATGSYPWTISSSRAPGTNYRIRVTSVSKPISDISNGDFTITA